MEPAGIHHVSICVDDLDAALAFYVEGLGFGVVDRPDFGFPGAWLDAGGQQVHLMVVPGDAAPPLMNHFALRVDDLDAAVADLRGRGITVDPSPHFPGAGRQAFLRDPAGNQIELNQPD